MSKKLIAGNWKMHLSVDDSRSLAEGVATSVADYTDSVDVVVCPGTVAITEVSRALKETPVQVGAQNIYHTDEGAFTGETSAVQIKDHAEYVITGHSERRQIFHETNEDVARKVAACIRSEMTPILCVGETGYERDHGETTQVINDQLATCLTMLVASDVEAMVVAYEPVWAIGTGENAKPDDVSRAVATIRSTIKEMFGEKSSQGTRVLYGGSVKADTAGSYLDLEGVDGLLVGGASLDENEFVSIVERASNGG